jgi:hypothetical protein
MRRSTERFSAVALVLGLGLVGWPTTSRAHEGEPGGDLGGVVRFADPVPDLGISYEFTLQLKRKEKAGFVWYVGAKSWNEPSNPVGLKGWTHTSNWVAIDLEEPAKLKVTIERQQGVVFPGTSGPEVARVGLVPAVSLYAGWDDTSDPEDHTFNNAGNFWSTVQYLGQAANPKGKSKIVFTTKGRLPIGKYSLVIGGNPLPLASLASYPVPGCDPLVRLCYAYTGSHGYRASIEAK